MRARRLPMDVNHYARHVDAHVQEAACRVLEVLAAVQPKAVGAEVAKVQARFRSKHYCERVLVACEAAQPGSSGA